MKKVLKQQWKLDFLHNNLNNFSEAFPQKDVSTQARVPGNTAANRCKL